MSPGVRIWVRGSGEVDENRFSGVDGDIDGDGVSVVWTRMLDLGINGYEGAELGIAGTIGVIVVERGHRYTMLSLLWRQDLGMCLFWCFG